jgi:hypothetical protein
VGDTRAISAPPESVARELPPWLRPVVYGFLAVFLACGLLSIELWPFTGFRLYSQVRHEARRGTSIVAVLDDGSEQTMTFADFPLGWHHTNLIAKEFGHMTQAERDEVCAGWVVPLEEDGLDVVEVRVETVVTHLSEPDRPTETVGVPYRCEL